MLGKSLYLFSSKVFGYGIRILLPIFLVRMMTKEEFGAYSQFFLLEILIQAIFQMGIIQSLYFFVPRDRENAGAYLLNSILINIVIFAYAYTIVWFFKDQVAAQLGMAIIQTYFWYLSTYSVLMMLNVAIVTYLAARQEILAASVFTILREILASIATLGAVFYFHSLEKVFLALVLSRGLTLLIGLLYIHYRLHGFRAKRYFFGLREQLRYGIVLGVGGALGIVALRLHEMTVSRYFDLEAYAVYAAGCKQIPILQFFGQSVSAVALGQFAMLVKKDDWVGVRALWDKVLATMYGVGLPVALVLLLASKPLVTLMFTADYAGAVPIFRLNTLATLSLVLNSTLVLRAMNRNDVTLKINIINLALLPFALYGGMKLWGLTGVIAVHAAFLLGSRVLAQSYLNHLAPVHLPIVASRRDIIDFYRTSYLKGMSAVHRLFHRQASGS